MRWLVTFFVLTFAVSWSLFIAAAAVSGSTASPSSGLAALSTFLRLLGVFAPSFVALALTAWVEGRAGTLALLRQMTPRPVAARWVVFAAGYTAAIKLAAAPLH